MLQLWPRSAGARTEAVRPAPVELDPVVLHCAGTQTLRVARVSPTPLPGLMPVEKVSEELAKLAQPTSGEALLLAVPEELAQDDAPHIVCARRVVGDFADGDPLFKKRWDAGDL